MGDSPKGQYRLEFGEIVKLVDQERSAILLFCADRFVFWGDATYRIVDPALFHL